MKIHSAVTAKRLVRHVLPLLVLAPLVAVAAPPAEETAPATSTELEESVVNDPNSSDSSDGKNLFDTLEDSDTASESARYKYSVRYIDGKRRKLETVRAASEPLAYRKVREKHPEADSILLIEVRRDGERVDRSRREGGSGRTIGGPLSGRSNRRSSNRKRFNMLAAIPEVPDSPFAKLIDQMHKQNIQNILRGKTFQDINMRMRQARIELEQRRKAAQQARQQAAASSSKGSGSGGSKTTFSQGNKGSNKKIGDYVKDGGKKGGKKGKKGGGTGGGAAKPASGGGGDSGINLGSGIPVNPNF